MPGPSEAPIPPELDLIEKEIEARRYVEQRAITFQLRPSVPSADALEAALEKWRAVIHPPALPSLPAEPDDEDHFRVDVLKWAYDHDATNYQIDPAPVTGGIVVELHTGDRFAVTVKQVYA